MSRFVIPLSSRRARLKELAGGKAASLARLTALGVPVPAGFVISARVFDDLARRIKTAPERFGDGTLPSCSFPGSQHAVLSNPLPSHIEKSIIASFHALGGEVAVRSSLVGEDGLDLSFAGQLDSFLGIADERHLIDAIHACWRSLIGERVSRYLSDRARFPSVTRSQHISMAVLIQRMVQPASAGIAFSADPDTGRRIVIIEAVHGLGVSAASGHANPDRYLIDERGAFTHIRHVDPAQPVLDESAIRELATLVRSVERHLGSPLDVEWARDRDQFFILQARPITSLSGKSMYSRKLASDMVPGLIKPLLWSTSIMDMTQNVFAPAFNAILACRDFDYTKLVKIIRSRVYANVTLFGELFSRLGMPTNFFEAVARDEAAVRMRPRPTIGFMTSLFRLMVFIVRYGWIQHRAERFIEAHDRRFKRFRESDWYALSPQQLIEAAAALREEHGISQWYMWLSAINMAVRRKLLSRFLHRYAPGIDPAILLTGHSGLKSLEPIFCSAEIATAAARLDPEMLGLLSSGDSRAIREALAATTAGREILEQFDRFMDRYGYLSASGTDFTVASWTETPGVIWRSIAQMALQPPETSRRNAAEARERVRASIAEQLSPLKRIQFERMLHGAIDYLKLRERMSFVMSKDAYRARSIYLALGQTFVRDGCLCAAEDIFYLEFDELRSLVEQTLDPAHARAMIANRKTALAMDASFDPGDIVCGDVSPPAPTQLADEGFLEGIAGSAGIARGYARIVRDPERRANDPRSDDILVVPFMDIGWTPIFAGIAGIVAETGGQLSHSAIIAREYGIPAVVGVAGAMQRIVEGQPLTVDGSRGRVYLSHV